MHCLPAIGRVRFVVAVTGFVARFVVRVAVFVVVVLTLVRVIRSLAVMTFARLAVLLVIGQFAHFVTFAGPEEDK